MRQRVSVPEHGMAESTCRRAACPLQKLRSWPVTARLQALTRSRCTAFTAPTYMSARPLLLCRHCSKVSVKYQDCKATCNSCEVLRVSVQSDTGLQIRIVQELSACQDLHPACAEWQKAGKCSREPKAMLELCQVSEGD